MKLQICFFRSYPVGERLNIGLFCSVIAREDLDSGVGSSGHSLRLRLQLLGAAVAQLQPSSVVVSHRLPNGRKG